METFGGGHDDPISVAVGGFCSILVSLLIISLGDCSFVNMVFLDVLYAYVAHYCIWLSIIISIVFSAD